VLHQAIKHLLEASIKNAAMFSNISWSSYLLFVAFVLIAWYLFVGLKFYSGELQAFASGKVSFFRYIKLTGSQTANIKRSKGNGTESDQPTPNVPPATDIEILSSRLTEAIASAAGKVYEREEFLFLLLLTLKEFPSFKETPFRSAIDELILSECEKYGIICPSADELQQLWIEVA
jgi:hypothetical protein